MIVGSPVWAGRMASPIRSLLKRRGLELHRVAYVVTRSTEQRSEEVYDQMRFLYRGASGCSAVSLPPGQRRATSSGATTLCRMSSAGWSRTEDPPCWRR